MRVLMVGGGCRGLALARELCADGHAVRAVTRDADNRERIEAAGAECWVGDPDVVGTLRYALENVTLLLWLLGTATGPREAVEPLHGSRLNMMLEKTTDTTVRGVVYESAGTVPAEVLEQGVAECEHAWRTNEIPYALSDVARDDEATWVAAVRGAIDEVLAAPRGGLHSRT
jgi:nucleoside-diphosphate-sugar epimerase